MKKQLGGIVRRIKSKSEITWQYDLSARKFYTAEQMFQKKEEERYPNQVHTLIHTEAHRQKIRDFRLNVFDQLREKIDMNRIETYATQPFEPEVITQQDVEFEDVTEEEMTELEE